MSLCFYALVPEADVPCGKGPSCSDAEMTIFGGLPLPVLSLLAFVAISLLVTQAQRRPSNE
jgi:disulfide bond formation protein DsbB